MIEYYKNKSKKDLFYINLDGLVCQEEWRDIPKFIGSYQISNLGRAKSLDRYVVSRRGVKRFFKGKILSQSLTDRGYLQIGLSSTKIAYTIQTHLVVAECFFNHKPNPKLNLVVDHKRNECRRNNSIFNLQIITGRENTSKDSKSKYTEFKGITPTKNGKWTVYIYIGEKKKSFCVGTFVTEKEASEEYIKAVKNWEEKKEVPKKHLKSSEFKGVSWVKTKGKWRATIYIESKLIHIGYYDSEHIAYEKHLEAMSNWDLKKEKPIKLFTSKYKGVYFDKQCGKWKAKKKINGKQTLLGIFKTENEAYIKTLE
jgi:hypothetical protein